METFKHFLEYLYKEIGGLELAVGTAGRVVYSVGDRSCPRPCHEPKYMLGGVWYLMLSY